MAVAIYWFWQLVSKVGFGLVYLKVMVHGMQRLAPATSLKLLRHGNLRITAAHVLCLFLLVCVWISWGMIIRLILGEDGVFERRSWNQQRHMWLVVIAGGLLILFDFLMFYMSVADHDWRGTTFAWKPFLTTLAFSVILVLMEYKSLELHERTKN